jgi:hypothetical protein
MEATFVIRPEELTAEWLEQLKSHFADDGTLTITAVGLAKSSPEQEHRAVNQREMFRQMEETRKKYPTTKIPADIDINKLIDEMYWEGNH